MKQLPLRFRRYYCRQPLPRRWHRRGRLVVALVALALAAGLLAEMVVAG